MYDDIQMYRCIAGALTARLLPTRSCLGFGLFLFVLSFAIVSKAQPDYPPAHYVPPACSKYYTTGNGHKLVVIHDMEGYYETTISYLNRCDTDTNGNYKVDTSINYMVNGLQNGSDEDGHRENIPNDAAPGDITESVRDIYYAWHPICLNRWSVGTEHEGFVSSPAWYTEAMYQASAGLQRYICDKYGIPKDRNHIVGHGEWQNAAWVSWMSTNFPSIDPTCNNHTDPGQYWNWAHFMALITNPPVITRQPYSIVAEPSSNATFSVVAASASTYQWRKNAANISGATGSTYTINNIQAANAGNYDVIVGNSGTTVTSRVAVLTVSPVWVPAFTDDFEANSSSLWNLFWGAGNGVSDYTVTWAFNYGTTKYAANGVTNFIPPAPNSGGTTHGLKLTVNKNDSTAATAGVSLYPKNLTFSGNYTLRFDMWINYNGVAGGGTGSTEFGTFGLNHTGTEVNWIPAAASSDGLWFAVDGEGGSGGSDYRAYRGNGAALATQLSFADSGLASSGATSDNVTNAAWQGLFPAPTYETQGAPGKHWVQCELIQIGNVITWQMNGVVIAQRTNTTSYTSGDIMIGYMDPFSSLASPATDSYGIFDNVRVLVQAIPPTIVTQPTNITVPQNSDAMFSVSASGTGPFTYQWRFNNAPIASATNSTFTKTNAQPADAGAYSVIVSNVAGNVTSSYAVLAVITPPSITAQPQSLTVTQGGNVSFTVAATGAPLAYHWQFNGIDLGAASSAYSFLNAQAANAGGYRCVISNPAGSVTSAVAILTVLLPPSIATQPQSQSVKSGTNVTFSVVASGTSPLGYQWRFNGADILGANGSSYTRSNVQTNDAGNYSVVITNIVRSVTSADAALMVLPPLPLKFNQIASVTPGDVKLVVSGDPGNYTVYCASNLVDWVALTNITILNDPVEIHDTTAVGAAVRFYRATIAQ